MAGRFRNFATVVYPESAPQTWKDILVDLKIPAFISPLHDNDINPTGEPKKAHFHVMLIFDGKKSVEQLQDIFSLFGGVGCEVVKSLRGYARYLCHLDNPEKAQYNVDDVQSLCGADYVGTIGLLLDKYKAIDEMISFCKDNSIYSYRYIFDYARKYRGDWFRCLCDNGTFVVREYLKSFAWEFANQVPEPDLLINPDTGEIIKSNSN